MPGMNQMNMGMMGQMAPPSPMGQMAPPNSMGQMGMPIMSQAGMGMGTVRQPSALGEKSHT